jgi:tRNA (guanine-N7-)-methyltransferase
LLRDVLPGVGLDISTTASSQLSHLFAERVTDIWLEIGFGGGEHLVWQAARNPGVGFIGCEPFQDGVLKVLDTIAAGQGSNIRLVADDARPLLRWLPSGSVGLTFILFPDPWPKFRHHKRRLINVRLLEMLARVMRSGAELRIASDVGDYVRAILHAIHRHGAFRWTARTADDWRKRGSDWPSTRYEAKAVAAGRRCYYLKFRRQ